MYFYSLFMEDSLNEAYQEMYKYLGEDGSGEKKEVYKINYYLRDNLQKQYVSEALSKPKNQDAIIEFVAKFLDDHVDQLSTSGPVYSFTFSDKETSLFYSIFSITAEKIIELYNNMIAETYNGNISKFITGWINNAPHKLLFTAILIDAIQNGYDDIVECCEYLWAFSEYPILYRMFWKTGVKEDVMKYTIEHLSTKFKVKKFANLKELLKFDAHSSVIAMKDRLESGVDNVYIDFMQRMRNQMKNKFKNIAKEYYDNDEKNATQHTNTSVFDDGSLADQEGYTTNINRIIDNTVSKFISGGLNTSMVKIVAEAAQIDKDNLSGYLNQIFTSKNNRLAKIIENIITAYFRKKPTNTSIGSTEFSNFGLSLYRSIGTSKDPLLKEIKDILNYWLYTIIDIKQYYSREATIINYTRAIFNYLIFMMNYYN